MLDLIAHQPPSSGRHAIAAPQEVLTRAYYKYTLVSVQIDILVRQRLGKYVFMYVRRG